MSCEIKRSACRIQCIMDIKHSISLMAGALYSIYTEEDSCGISGLTNNKGLPTIEQTWEQKGSIDIVPCYQVCIHKAQHTRTVFSSRPKNFDGSYSG
jgi:hypothetical protein